MCLKSGRLAHNIAALVLKWRLRFTYKSWSRKKCKAKPVNTEMSTMSMRISTARPALSGASPNHLSMKSIRLTRLSRQASCRTPERCATSHNRRGYGVGPWSNTVLHHRLQTSVLRKWNTRNGRRAFSLAASILTALGSAALDCARLSPQKNRAGWGGAVQGGFQGGEKTVRRRSCALALLISRWNLASKFLINSTNDRGIGKPFGAMLRKERQAQQ